MEQRAMTITIEDWVRENIFLRQSFKDYIKGLFTPFNAVCGIILAVGIPTMIWRFLAGLGATTNLSDSVPWGLWLGFDMFAGVAVATGGFVVGTLVYIFGAKEYHSFVRPAVLGGFLGYAFAVIGLCFDLGRPWRLPYPFLVSMGTASVLFLVAEHLALYILAQFLEWCPAIAEWLHMKKLRAWLSKLTIASIILGAVLVTGHQSALGAIYLIMPSKLHPLWYTPFIPFLFYISAIAGGIAMLVIESMLSHKAFAHQIPHKEHKDFDRLTVGLGKAAAFVLFTYFCLKILSVAHGQNWDLLNTKYGHLFLIEVLGFVLVPCILYYRAVITNSAKLVRITSVITVIGVMFNRLNVCILALNWESDAVYRPKWSEYVVSLTLITIGVLIFRAVVNRMPILYTFPEYRDEH